MNSRHQRRLTGANSQPHHGKLAGVLKGTVAPLATPEWTQPPDLPRTLWDVFESNKGAIQLLTISDMGPLLDA